MENMADEQPALHMVHAAHTDVGQVRKVNEDAYGVDEVGHGWLFVVADGMGGHQAGDVASRLAVKSIVDGFRQSTAIDPSRRLMDSLKVAHQRIMSRQGRASGTDRMGTTAVTLYTSGNLAHYAWVGDSRIYLVRDGQLSAITRDHTVGRELRDRQLLPPEEIDSHPDAHKLSRALGMEDQWQPECGATPLVLEPGDMFLMCTDGLFKVVDDSAVLSALLGMEPVEAAIKLVALANERGGHDNITVQVVHVGSREAAVEAAAREGHIGSLTQELQALMGDDSSEMASAPKTERLGPGDVIPDAENVGDFVDPRTDEPTIRIGPGDTVRTAPVSDEELTGPQTPDEPIAEPVKRGDTVESRDVGDGGGGDDSEEEKPTAPYVPSVPDPERPASSAPRAESLPIGPGEPPPAAQPPRAPAPAPVPAPRPASAQKAAREDDALDDRGDVDDRPRRRRLPVLLIVAVPLLLLLFVILIGALVTVAVGVMLPRGRDGGDAVRIVSVDPGAAGQTRDEGVRAAATAIRSVDELRECDWQWQLLRQHHDTLAADPYTFQDLAGRVYRCYDEQAWLAMEAWRASPDADLRKTASSALGRAGRFLDPPSRADDALTSVAQAVQADLGPEELAGRLSELERWEAELD